MNLYIEYTQYIIYSLAIWKKIKNQRAQELFQKQSEIISKNRIVISKLINGFNTFQK